MYNGRQDKYNYYESKERLGKTAYPYNFTIYVLY